MYPDDCVVLHNLSIDRHVQHFKTAVFVGFSLDDALFGVLSFNRSVDTSSTSKDSNNQSLLQHLSFFRQW